MADHDALEQNVAEAVTESMSNDLTAEVNTHISGPAIDLQKGGEATSNASHRFFTAAHDAGYVVSAVKRFENPITMEPHTRLFLCEANYRLGIEKREDKARAEGFAAGLFLGTSVAFEMGLMSPLAGMMVGDLESLYPEVAGDEDVSLFDGTQDVAVEEMVEELESLEGEGIEATMFEPMDGYEDGDVPRGE